MKRPTRKPSPTPHVELDGPDDGRHLATAERPPGFTYPVPKGDDTIKLFVPFAWYVCGPTNLIAARRDALLRASAYGEVPEGLSVVLDPL